MVDWIQLDGSMGEGGGQILRTALTMSLLEGKPFQISHIRANRPQPGLKPQHLMAIQAAAQISGSTVEGAVKDSQDLKFIPGSVKPGKYVFSVDTAGAMSLVLHTIFLPLALTHEVSHLEFHGGTHVPWAPCFEYLNLVWRRMLAKLGFHIELELKNAGYYPKGGGCFLATIYPITKVLPLTLIQEPFLTHWEIIGIVSNLPASIVDREWQAFEKAIAHCNVAVPLQKTLQKYPSPGQGNLLFLNLEYADTYAGLDVLGERGKSAETVGYELGKCFEQFLKTNRSVDEHLADQVLLPLAFASGRSDFSVSQISEHLLTNAQIIQKFKNIEIQIQGKLDEPGQVRMQA